MTDAHATVSQKRGINPIWFVPIVALALGIWMVIYTLQQEGPEITITFSTAEGIEEGKTKIKLRNVDIGVVEDVRLAEGAETVIITASLDNEAEPLLHSDTQFWVVRPRIGKSGISGLGTLLSGGYIQIAPGSAGDTADEFVGLEDPPVTPAGTPGKRVVLTADRAGSVGPGDPIVFKGYTIGTVETETFNVDEQRMDYQVFIHAPYDEKLTDRHRFWDASGVTAKLGADGIEITTAALETLLIGGIEIGLPKDVGPGEPIAEGAEFALYASYDEVNRRPFRESFEMVVRFAQSVRGLGPGAPVEYRGVQVGEVVRVMIDELADEAGTEVGQAIPVLIRVEPARMHMPDTPDSVDAIKGVIREGVKRGFRASLVTGNILTGQLFIAMDYFPNAEPAGMGEYSGYETIPSVSGGLEGALVQVTSLLNKLNGLPLETTVAELNSVLGHVDQLVANAEPVPTSLDDTLREVEVTLASFSAESELQTRLLPTITELERTLASLRSLLSTLDQQPNALVFDRAHSEDPTPPAGNQ